MRLRLRARARCKKEDVNRVLYTVHVLRPTISQPPNLFSLWVNPAALDFAPPIQVRSLHHQVQAFILKASYEGSLGPGDRLNESTISVQLGISRTPVREALTYLESSGLVVRIPRRGFFLASLSAEDAVHCYAMREMLEGYAARTIAGRLSETQIRALHEIVDRMEPAVRTGNWPQAAMHNIAFHEAVVGMAENPVLLRMWTSVGPVLWFFDSLTRRTAEPSAGREFVQRHEMLLTALTKKNPNAAASAFVTHIDSVKRAIVERLKTGRPGRKEDAGTGRVKGDASQRGERE